MSFDPSNMTLERVNDRRVRCHNASGSLIAMPSGSHGWRPSPAHGPFATVGNVFEPEPCLLPCQIGPEFWEILRSNHKMNGIGDFLLSSSVTLPLDVIAGLDVPPQVPPSVAAGLPLVHVKYHCLSAWQSVVASEPPLWARDAHVLQSLSVPTDGASNRLI